jgi:transketolase
MRKEFSQAIERIAGDDERVVFITGDLGFNALENVQAKLGERFINAGVAEQNMVGLAAGMAYRGYRVFCYSIAPFVVYRCLEQFRNDACLHNLPVFLVGNGGGYGYGIMGSTHHALEDLAALSGLQNVACYVPGFADEVETCVQEIVGREQPAYLRLGVGRALPDATERSGSFRIVRRSERPAGTVVALGPAVSNVLNAFNHEDLADRFNVLTALTLPLHLTDEVAHLIHQSGPLLVVEEHVSVGGLAQQLSVKLLERGIAPAWFRSLTAQGYPGGRYGDQNFHQQQSGLDAGSIAHLLRELV